jgi:hypothetical protein
MGGENARMQYLQFLAATFSLATSVASAATYEGPIDAATKKGLEARPDALFMTRALVATASRGKTLLDVGGREDPQIAKVYSQLAEIERNCDRTLRGAMSVPDRFGKAAIETDTRDELSLVEAFVHITRNSCSKYSLDSMLTAYVLERNAGATHHKVLDGLAADPRALLAKWRGKRFEHMPPVTLDGAKERPGAPRIRDFR